MGAAAGPIGMGLQVIGTLYGAVSQYQGLRQQAATDRENARLSELEGAQQESDIRREERAVSGDAIAAMGANGLRVGTGSALALLEQNAIERETAVLNARYGAARQALALREQARAKKKAAGDALFTGILSAGAQALTGMSSASASADVSAAAGNVRAAQLPALPGQSMPLPSTASLTGQRPATRAPSRYFPTQTDDWVNW
ncbi:hypothetical protein FHS96_004988 [Sphingomonas zeicaulis]|uniref:hypothetical protein n=1 Tax=Sphingomonas zeicaulis TaxID=1632740 RepID=UPI003D2542A9